MSSEAVFRSIVPFLILAACALLAVQVPLRKWLFGRGHRHAHPIIEYGSVGLASIYGGYFGAGLGIMMLAVLGLLFSESINRLNAQKQVLSLVVNVTAALFFVWTGKVYWGLAIAMAPASMLGGWCGGRLADVVSGTALRRVVVTYGTVLGLYYLLR